jgi:protein TonB
MNYAVQANRPNAAAVLGALGVPAAFGILLVTGLAITAVIPVEGTELEAWQVKIDIEPLPDDATPRAEPDATTQQITQQVPQNLAPPRPDTDLTFNTGPSQPIGNFSGFGPITAKPADFGIPGPAPASRFDPVSAKAVGNPGRWVSDSDYRSRWINEEMSGVAQFALAIDKSGRVSDCTITASTGHDALDTATCSLLERRARFDPARDSDGNPVAGNYRSSIRWNLPE